MVPRSHGVLLSENSYRGVSKLAIGLLRPFFICCNSIGLTLQRAPVADTPPVVGKPELVVAYEGTLRISLRKDGAGLPPRAGPCARAPLSPPAAPASFSAIVSRAPRRVSLLWLLWLRSWCTRYPC